MLILNSHDQTIFTQTVFSHEYINAWNMLVDYYRLLKKDYKILNNYVTSNLSDLNFIKKNIFKGA